MMTIQSAAEDWRNRCERAEQVVQELRRKLDMTGRWPDDTASETQVASVFPRDDEGNY